MSYTKNITYDESLRNRIRLSTLELIQVYVQRKHSVFLAAKFDHKILWHKHYGLFISEFRAHEQPHIEIAARIFGKENTSSWYPGIMQIIKNKDNTINLVVYGESSDSGEIGSLPSLPEDSIEEFIHNIIRTFKDIYGISQVKVGAGKIFYKYDSLTRTTTPISVREFSK